MLIDAALALATGFGLWAVLPRGVVLVKSRLTRNFDGDPLYDTWTVQNDSALPVRILSVTYRNLGTFQGNQWAWAELTEDDDNGLHGVWLHLDDEVPEIRRMDSLVPWGKVVIPPGDSMTAHVPNNSDLRIKYRRAGLFGIFERRAVLLSGGA